MLLPSSLVIEKNGKSAVLVPPPKREDKKTSRGLHQHWETERIMQSRSVQSTLQKKRKKSDEHNSDLRTHQRAHDTLKRIHKSKLQRKKKKKKAKYRNITICRNISKQFVFPMI